MQAVKHILVVDNDPVMLSLMTRLLVKQGHEVKTAEDGLSALNVIKDFTPDIMFIDLVMPNITGDRLCRIVRAIPKLQDIFIVIVSGVAAEEQLNLAEFGADVCLAKGPFGKLSTHILNLVNLDFSKKAPLQSLPDLSPHRSVIGLEYIDERGISKELLASRRHFETILNNMAEGIIEITPAGKIIFANPSAIELLATSEEKLLAASLPDLFQDAHKTRVCGLICGNTQTSELRDDMVVMLGKKHVSLDLIPVKHEGFNSNILILNDVSHRRQAEEALKNSENTYRTIFETTGTATILVETDMTISLANSRVESMFGYRREEIEGKKKFHEFLPDENAKQLQIFHELRRNAEKSDVIPSEYETRLVDKKGTVRDVLVNVGMIPGTRKSVASIADITSRKEAERRMKHIALHDALTELPNRNLFFDRSGQAISRATRYATMVAFLYVDLDGFKAINDTFGHEAGDITLKEVARRIGCCIREMDTAARLGGDEFAVILQDVKDRAFAESAARRIIQAIIAPIHIKSHHFVLGASIGISVFPENGRDTDTLIRKSDAAMYRVKKSGKNNCLFYDCRTDGWMDVEKIEKI